MKTLRFFIVFLFVLNCTNDSPLALDDQLANNVFSPENCTNDQPKARLTNNGTVNHSLKIFDENSNVIVSAFNIEPGSTTGWFEFDPQEVVFTVDNDTYSDEKVEAIMENCMQFDMEIGVDDALVSYDITTN